MPRGGRSPGPGSSSNLLMASQSGNSIDPFLEDRKKQQPGAAQRDVRYLRPNVLPKSYHAISDGDGRFLIRGVAAERVCETKITADQFATATLLIVNRQGLDTAPYNLPPQRMPGRVPDLLVGPDFTYVGAPGLTVEGQATAAMASLSQIWMSARRRWERYSPTRRRTPMAAID